MTVCRGEVWLANLNPVKRNNEIGKTRPVVVLQNDELNEGGYPTTIVMPLTSDLIDDAEPLRMRIRPREKLELDSDVLIAHIRSIDNSRFVQKLATLSHEEMRKLKELLDEVVL